KHILLFPCNPKECFEMTADSFDLAERLQTPVIIMSDLDLGMNDHISLPLEWDDSRTYDRGKVLDAGQLEAMTEKWGRYLDREGDGICYRTFPGTHPTLGAYFTRGSSHDEYAAYTEDNDAYERCMVRLTQKWHTAKPLVPGPHIKIKDETCVQGAIFFGTSAHSAYEAMDQLGEQDVIINTMRLRGFPFQEAVTAFVDRHDHIFVIEQNRDGQMRTLLINECNIRPDKLLSIPAMDGLPITAGYITRSIEAILTPSVPPGTNTHQGGAQ
ncbi:MAG: 2-oxoacid:acceptor oxidoreductase subunit alpha, partial [Desulfobacula sp.]|nr:2-oxoacid:acceptor oxidoreductase subunit alpha [Desulfobacula sp.]